MQTAIIGEAEIRCTTDDDFFDKPAGEYLRKMGVTVMDDISLNAPLALLKAYEEAKRRCDG